MSKSRKSQSAFFAFVEAAAKLAKTTGADAILILTQKSVDWTRLKNKTSICEALIIATHSEDVARSSKEAEITTTLLEKPEATVQNQLTQAVLSSVASEKIEPGSTVVSIYSGFDTEHIDTISVLKLTERLGRLTARDLRKLETKVPLETLKTVVDLAVEIGREGREGKPVGTMFVVGDHRKVLEESRPGGFDFVKGYSRKERNLSDFRVREGIKEIAQIDGMFIIAADGTVEASGTDHRHFSRSNYDDHRVGFETFRGRRH